MRSWHLNVKLAGCYSDSATVKRQAYSQVFSHPQKDPTSHSGQNIRGSARDELFSQWILLKQRRQMTTKLNFFPPHPCANTSSLSTGSDLSLSDTLPHQWGEGAPAGRLCMCQNHWKVEMSATLTDQPVWVTNICRFTPAARVFIRISNHKFYTVSSLQEHERPSLHLLAVLFIYGLAEP